jgi:hypothetical protein
MRYYGIEERKLHNMLWDSIKYWGGIILGGFLAGIFAIVMLLIYCRMAGPLM